MVLEPGRPSVVPRVGWVDQTRRDPQRRGWHLQVVPRRPGRRELGRR